MSFKKQEPIETPLPPFPAPQEENAASAEENPFAEVGVKLVQLMQEGKIPEDFDLEATCQDKAFAELVLEMEPEAAIRVYVAEKKAENAMREALDMVQKRLEARNALPKMAKAGGAISATPDYASMSAEDFRSLENQLRNATRSGKKMRF